MNRQEFSEANNFDELRRETRRMTIAAVGFIARRGMATAIIAAFGMLDGSAVAAEPAPHSWLAGQPSPVMMNDSEG